MKKKTSAELHVSIKPLQTKIKPKVFTQSFVHVAPEFKSHNHWEIIFKKLIIVICPGYILNCA